ncbi:MAG: hypothetical protein HY819_14745 [Acidobacteria bacterium]|nr:hypothetical protein [Acidobacteriota bacterium]
MTKRLVFIIFFSIFNTFNIFNLSCTQNSTPQPKLTILSAPASSPSPENEPTPLLEEKLTTQVNDNFTPKDTVQAFCQADFNGVRTSIDTYEQVIPYVIWAVEIEKDAHIVSDFKIVNSREAEDEANIAVIYTKVGKLFEGKIENFDATSDIVTYKLIKESGRWKIQYPIPPAYISLEVAKNLVKK